MGELVPDTPNAHKELCKMRWCGLGRWRRTKPSEKGERSGRVTASPAPLHGLAPFPFPTHSKPAMASIPELRQGLGSATIVAPGSNSAFERQRLPPAYGSSPGCGTWAIGDHSAAPHALCITTRLPAPRPPCTARPPRNRPTTKWKTLAKPAATQRNLRVERLDGGRFGSPVTLCKMRGAAWVAGAGRSLRKRASNRVR